MRRLVEYEQTIKTPGEAAKDYDAYWKRCNLFSKPLKVPQCGNRFRKTRTSFAFSSLFTSGKSPPTKRMRMFEKSATNCATTFQVDAHSFKLQLPFSRGPYFGRFHKYPDGCGAFVRAVRACSPRFRFYFQTMEPTHRT